MASVVLPVPGAGTVSCTLHMPLPGTVAFLLAVGSVSNPELILTPTVLPGWHAPTALTVIVEPTVPESGALKVGMASTGGVTLPSTTSGDSPELSVHCHLIDIPGPKSTPSAIDQLPSKSTPASRVKTSDPFCEKMT